MIDFDQSKPVLMTIKHQLQILEHQNEAIAHLIDNDLNCSTKHPSMLNQE